MKILCFKNGQFEKFILNSQFYDFISRFLIKINYKYVNFKFVPRPENLYVLKPVVGTIIKEFIEYFTYLRNYN
jgi:hypothetical protein